MEAIKEGSCKLLILSYMAIALSDIPCAFQHCHTDDGNISGMFYWKSAWRSMLPYSKKDKAEG
jgi:hypothetical protein